MAVHVVQGLAEWMLLISVARQGVARLQAKQLYPLGSWNSLQQWWITLPLHAMLPHFSLLSSVHPSPTSPSSLPSTLLHSIPTS